MMFPKMSPGGWFLLGITVVFVLLAVLSGCGTQTIVRADRMAYCDQDLDPKLLSEPCAASSPLPDGATYQDGLNGKRVGDSALESCGHKTIELQKALATCHRLTATYNATIDALNKPN